MQDLSKKKIFQIPCFISIMERDNSYFTRKSSLSLEDINKTDLSTLLDSNDSLGQDSMQLILQSLGLFYVLNQSYEERALQKLCEYLKNLAKSFHTFYNAHRILQTEHEAGILKNILICIPKPYNRL